MPMRRKNRPKCQNLTSLPCLDRWALLCRWFLLVLWLVLVAFFAKGLSGLGRGRFLYLLAFVSFIPFFFLFLFLCFLFVS